MDELLRLWWAFNWPVLAIVTPLVALSWRRVSWRWWEALALVVPYAVWLYLDTILHLPKSLSNLGELAVIVVGIPVAALIRVLAARRLPQMQMAVLLQVLLVGAIVFEYLTTPFRPE